MDLQFGHPIVCPLYIYIYILIFVYIYIYLFIIYIYIIYMYICPKRGTTKFDVDRFSVKMAITIQRPIQMFFELVYPDLRPTCIPKNVWYCNPCLGRTISILLWGHFQKFQVSSDMDLGLLRSWVDSSSILKCWHKWKRKWAQWVHSPTENSFVWGMSKVGHVPNAQCRGRLSLEISRRCCPIREDAWLYLVGSNLDGHSNPYLCICLLRCARPIY